MDAISGAKTPVITMNEIQQADIRPVKTTESGGKTPVEMGQSPVKSDDIGANSGIALPKPATDSKDTSILNTISSSLADLQSLLSGVKDAKDQISNKLNEMKNFASADNLKASANELNLSSNWQIAFSVISGVLSVGSMVLSNVAAYQDHVAAQQEKTLSSGIEKTQSDIAGTSDALKNPDLTAESRAELESQLSELKISLATQQDALSELQAGSETRKAWTELALNLMQGASGFINDNLISKNADETGGEGDPLSAADNILGHSAEVLDKAKEKLTDLNSVLQIPAKA